MSTQSLSKLGKPEHTLLGPNYTALKFWGLLLPKNIAKKYFYYFMNFFLIIFIGTTVVEMCVLKSDTNLLLNNIKTSLPSAVNAAKVTSLMYWPKQWEAVINYVIKADLVQRKSSDTKKINVLNKYTKHCRIKTYLYWSLLYATVLILILTPVLKYILSSSYRANTRNGTEKYVEIFSSWVPFDKTTLLGYLGVSAYQIWATTYSAGWIVTFDATAMVVMVFFRCELEMLRIDSAKIFGDGTQSVEDSVAFNRLKNCHRRHVEMVKHAKLFDLCLSPVMFLDMLVCSVIMCVTAYQIADGSSAVQKLSAAEYLIFIVSELFIYYWHSNDVFCASQELMLGTYESSWWKMEVKRRKDVYILTEQLKTIVVFSAGPFSKLTVPTYINILKAAYSYYVLLRNKTN